MNTCFSVDFNWSMLGASLTYDKAVTDMVVINIYLRFLDMVSVE